MLSLGAMLILFSICIAINLLIVFSSYHERFIPNDPEKKRFGHKPRMKYITKLSCGQVVTRLWVSTYGPFDYEFGKEEDNSYIFTINSMTGWGAVPGKAKYKIIIIPEQEGSAVYCFIVEYKASEYALDVFAWELKRFLEKKLEAVRVE